MSGWTEKKIQMALCSSRGPVPFDRYICVPNVTSCVARYTGESDLIAVSPAGYIKEFEVKISVSDLKKDKAKVKHHYWEVPGNLVCELWYAMPESVADACDVFAHIPEYAGVLVIGKTSCGIDAFTTRRKAKRKPNAEKLPPEKMLAMTRLGYMRYWTNEFKAEKKQGE